jgi:hypothetical protein
MAVIVVIIIVMAPPPGMVSLRLMPLIGAAVWHGTVSGRGLGQYCRRGHFCFGSVKDLVQLTAVQPDTAARRAIVNLDPAAFGDHQCVTVNRAFHF